MHIPKVPVIKLTEKTLDMHSVLKLYLQCMHSKIKKCTRILLNNIVVNKSQLIYIIIFNELVIKILLFNEDLY